MVSHLYHSEFKIIFANQLLALDFISQLPKPVLWWFKHFDFAS